jgi:hypothetical protein
MESGTALAIRLGVGKVLLHAIAAHFVGTAFEPRGYALGKGRAKTVLAETLILNTNCWLCAAAEGARLPLQPADRLLLGFVSRFLEPRRLVRAAVIPKPAALLRFHRGSLHLKLPAEASSGWQTRSSGRGSESTLAEQSTQPWEVPGAVK